MSLKITGKQKVFAVFLFLLVLFTIVGGVCFLGPLPKPRGLNVVLVTIDALRADHLGCYGCKRNTSPNIDALAWEGTVFT